MKRNARRHCRQDVGWPCKLPLLLMVVWVQTELRAEVMQGGEEGDGTLEGTRLAVGR